MFAHAEKNSETVDSVNPLTRRVPFSVKRKRDISSLVWLELVVNTATKEARTQ
jgi:hypothetical protein